MVIPGRETSGGSLAVEAWQQCADGLDTYSAVACGPGLTTEGDSRAIVEALLAACDQPLLLDADALNVLAGNLVPLKNASAPVVITPHPGELARLLGVSARDIQNDRITAAAEAAEQLGCVVVLKGAGTLVATPSGRLHVNLQGNPGMATGGSGDVLTGLLGGFLGQGLSAEDAARAAVYVHGLAGDIAAWASSQQGMIASDIVDCLPDAFLKILAR
jgi:NAD(P)H-hydrate epimerase